MLLSLQYSDLHFEVCWNVERWELHWRNNRNREEDLSGGEFLLTKPLQAVTLCQAHKLILSASSPYFRQLFSSLPVQHPTVILKVRILHDNKWFCIVNALVLPGGSRGACFSSARVHVLWIYLRWTRLLSLIFSITFSLVNILPRNPYLDPLSSRKLLSFFFNRQHIPYIKKGK